MKRYVGGEKPKMELRDVVLMAVSFFLVAILGPLAIGTVANTTVVNWTATTIITFQVLLPIIWVIGVAIKYIPRGK